MRIAIPEPTQFGFLKGVHDIKILVACCPAGVAFGECLPRPLPNQRSGVPHLLGCLIVRASAMWYNNCAIGYGCEFLVGRFAAVPRASEAFGWRTPEGGRWNRAILLR